MVPTSRAGGAVVVSVAALGIAALSMISVSAAFSAGLAATVGVAAVLGLLDDLLGLGALPKLAGLGIVAGLGTAVAGPIEAVPVPFKPPPSMATT